METFTAARPFSPHPGYSIDRNNALLDLEVEIQRGSIDAPLLPLIQECRLIPHCFTLQCCFGHFVYDGEPDRENLILPTSYRGTVENVLFRLAYLTVCLQDNPGGREMYADLEALTSLNPDYIQFGSADWFWEQMINTYCIQLEPDWMKTQDSGMISQKEALLIEKLRPIFFNQLAAIIRRHHV
jgi:hypothetical protein